VSLVFHVQQGSELLGFALLPEPKSTSTPGT
jgi:hypothetical protein